MIKQHRGRLALFAVIIVILAWGCYYLFSRANLSLILSRRWDFWAMQIAILSSYFAIATFFVGVLIRGMGVPAKFPDLFLILMTSQSSSYLGPLKLGIPLRIYLFKRMMGASYATGVSATLLAQYIRVLSIVLICALGVIAKYYQYTWMLLVVLLLMGLAVAAAVLCVRWLKRIEPRGKMLIRAKVFVMSMAEKARMVPPRQWIVAGAMALVMNAVMSLSSYCIITSCGGTISFVQILFIDAFAVFVGFVSFMPMGLGTRDATYLFFLTSIGMPRDTVCTVILIQRMIWSLAPIAVGIVSSLIIAARLFRPAGTDPSITASQLE